MQNVHDRKMLHTGNKHLNVKQMSNKSNQEPYIIGEALVTADLEARSYIHDFLVFQFFFGKLTFGRDSKFSIFFAPDETPIAKQYS